jgi:hypothetical protein
MIGGLIDVIMGTAEILIERFCGKFTQPFQPTGRRPYSEKVGRGYQKGTHGLFSRTGGKIVTFKRTEINLFFTFLDAVARVAIRSLRTAGSGAQSTYIGESCS